MRKHFALVIGLLLLVSLLAGCAQEEAEKKKSKVKKDKETIELASYIGSDACISCHSDTGESFAMTSHATAFKTLAEYDVNWDKNVVVWDDANKDKPTSQEVNLKNSSGVMMDYYVVGEVDNFSMDLYRLAAVEKTEQGYKITPAKASDYNNDGQEDWGAKSYSCTTCHSPGLAAEGPGVTNLEPGISCETCHGPGAIHAQTKKPEAIGINEEACITCHTLGEPSEAKDGDYLIADNHNGTRNWFASDHYTSGYVSCLNCHTPHSNNEQGIMLQQNSFEENCASCHKGAEFDIDEIMWKNPTDKYGHITRDHSFGAFSYEELGDNPDTKEIEITDPKVIKEMKKLMEK